MSQSQLKDPFTNLEIIEPERNNRCEVKKSKFDTYLHVLKLIQWISVVITIILSSISLDNFYRTDKRMRLICVFGVVSLFINLVLYIISNKFVKNSLIIIGVCIFQFLQFSIWMIGLGLVSAKYPLYNCDRQGGSQRINGCKCGQASIAFISLNFLLYFSGFIILIINVTSRRYNELKNLKFKSHLLSLEDHA